MAEEPCERWHRAAALVEKAVALLDPLPERRDGEDYARHLRVVGREVHESSCVIWRRVNSDA